MFPRWNAIDERRRRRGCWSRVSQSDRWYQKDCASRPNTFSAINDTLSLDDVSFIANLRNKFYDAI